jgi:hypothetical protein
MVERVIQVRLEAAGVIELEHGCKLIGLFTKRSVISSIDTHSLADARAFDYLN